MEKRWAAENDLDHPDRAIADSLETLDSAEICKTHQESTTITLKSNKESSVIRVSLLLVLLQIASVCSPVCGRLE